MTKQKTATIEAAPGGDVGSTSAELRAKIEKLDDELAAAQQKVTGYESEKAELLAKALVDDDVQAGARVDELNEAIGRETRRQQDLGVVLAPLREQEATARTREEEATVAAAIARLEVEVPKAHAAAEGMAAAILEQARQLRPLVSNHQAALATYRRLEKRLREVTGEAETFVEGLGELSPARIAVRVVDEAGLPGVVSAADVLEELARANAEANAAFASGLEQGRRAVQGETSKRAGQEIRPDGTIETAVERRRREIYG